MEILTKILRVASQADKIELNRTDRKYDIFKGDNKISLRLNNCFFSHRMDVYFNDRPWHTGIDINKDVKVLIKAVDKMQFEHEENEHEANRELLKEKWNKL